MRAGDCLLDVSGVYHIMHSPTLVAHGLPCQGNWADDECRYREMR